MSRGKQGSPGEKEKGKEWEKERRSRTPSKSRKGAELRTTEPASSAAGGSKGPIKMPSPGPEKEKKRALENEQRLKAAVQALFQCKTQRSLRDRVCKMHSEFYAQERARKNASDTNRTLGKGEMGFSCSKRRLDEERQLAFKSSNGTSFDQVLQAAEDAKLYDSDADDEAEQLDVEIEWEKDSQKRWKADRRKATEKWDK